MLAAVKWPARPARSLSLALAVVASTWAGAALGGGFYIDEHDARSTGRAGAVVADPGNASAVHFNPAGLARLYGVHLNLGASIVAPTAGFTAAIDGTETKADEQVFVLPQVFVGGRVSQLVTLGFGITSPFGLALDWPATSPGREQVRLAHLRTLFITPAVGVDLSRWLPGLGVGAGIDLVPASVRLNRDILFGTDTGSVALSATAFGLGARAGILYRPAALPQLSLGLTYRSPVKLDFSGEADFDAPPPYRASLPRDGDGSTGLTLPQSVALGVLFEPLPGWGIEADGTWRDWSSYDKLDIRLPNGETTSARKDWEDTFTLRIGTEYTFAERVTARLGFIYDPTPVPTTTLDFQLPDADRIDLTAGFGAAITPNIRIDAGVLWVLPQERSTSNANPFEPPVKGRYEIEVWVAGLTVAMQFGHTAPPPAGGERYPLPPIDPVYSPAASWPGADPAHGADGPCRRRPRLRALPNASRCAEPEPVRSGGP